MADDVQPRIVLDGDVSPLRQKFREAAADLKKFGAEGESAFGRMMGPLGALQSKFVAVGAILAGGAVFKEAVKQAADFTEQSMKLGQALGSSATEASTYIAALEDIDVSQGDFVGAAKAMSKEIKNNEEVLQGMGLKTRDAAGNLRPLNQLVVEGIGILNGYKAGTDRAIAGQAMFGRNFELTGNLLKLNSETLRENAELQKRLGVIVSSENVAAWEAFDAAGDRANLTLKAVNTTIGNALLPVLTDLGNWFVSIGPAAIVVIRGALGGLVATFHLITTGVTVLWETINAMVVSVAEPIRALGAAIFKALQGDWAGAKSEIAGIGTTIKDAWGTAMDEMVAKSQSTRDRIWNLFAEGTPSAAPSSDGKSASGLLTPPDKNKAKEKKEPVDPSMMAAYEARLAELKNLYEQENVLRQFSKQQELDYWRDLQATKTLGSKDAVTIAKRTAMLELEIRRELAAQNRAIDSALLDSKRANALGQIELEQQQARFARENGQISKMELLELEEQFARRRFEIEYQALLERQELLKNDPNTTPAALAQIKQEMLQIERQYQLQKGEINQSKKKQSNTLGGVFEDSGQAFGNMARNLLTSATTLRQQLGQVFQAISASFINALVSKPLAEWLAAKAKMLAISLGFMAEESAAESASATAQIIEQTAVGVKGVTSNSAIAATAAMASVAAIPFVGWAMAPGVGAQTYALGLGYLASARGGFDIPPGLNPMTQLHEEEMVLPEVHANTIRRLGEMGGASAAPAPVNFHVTAVDAQSVERLFRDNGHVMAKELRRQARNFSPRTT